MCARQNARSRKADSSVHGKSKQTQRVYSSVQGTAARAASQLQHARSRGRLLSVQAYFARSCSAASLRKAQAGSLWTLGGSGKSATMLVSSPPRPARSPALVALITRASAGQPASRSSLSELHLKKVLVQPRSQSALPWGADESGAPPHDLIADGGPPAQMREAWQEPAADAAPAATT